MICPLRVLLRADGEFFQGNHRTQATSRPWKGPKSPICGWLRNPFRTTVQKPNGRIRFAAKYQQTMVSTMVLKVVRNGFCPSAVCSCRAEVHCSVAPRFLGTWGPCPQKADQQLSQLLVGIQARSPRLCPASGILTRWWVPQFHSSSLPREVVGIPQVTRFHICPPRPFPL